MSLAHYQSTAVDEAGNVLSGATVTVRRESDGSLAAIKSDRGGASAKANPFTTDADGMFDFYVVGGAYKITVVSGSLTRTYRYVAIGTAAELDASDLAGLHGLLYDRLTSTSAASITAGKFSGNNADLALATALYFSTTDANGNDEYARLLTFDDSTSAIKGVLSVSLTSGETITFAVTSATDLTDSSPAYDVVSLAVTLLSGADAQIAGDSVYCDFYATGDKGDQGDQGIQGIQGIQGLTGPSPTLYWDYDSTTTDSDPGSGFFRINNATHSSATAIYVDNNSARGFSDVSAWLDTIDDSGDSTLRGYLLITQLDDPTVFLSYAVSGSVVDGTGYRKLTVAYIAGNGSLLDSSPGAVCSFDFIPRGPAGTGDVSATASFGTDNRAIRSDGTSKNIQSSGITIDDSDNVSGVVSLSFGGKLTATGVLSPSQITGNQNDYGPTGYDPIVVYRLSTDASRDITGLQGGSSGKIVAIVNVGLFNVVLKKDDGATSTAANRFAFANDVTLSANQGCILVYDGTSSRWRLVGRNLDQALVAFLAGGQNLTGGFTGTSYAGGTVTGSNQTYTPSCANTNIQHITLNGSSLTGTFTFAVPTVTGGDCGQTIVEVVNGGSGSVGATLSASGYTKAETAAYNTTNGNKFLFVATKTKNYSYLQVVALQ